MFPFNLLTKLWEQLLALAVVAALCWYAVHSYNSYVSQKAVDKALVEERAVTKPKIEKLTAALATSKAEVKARDEASAAERARQVAEAALKTKLYNEVVKQNANLSAKLKSSFIAADTLAGQLRDITARSRTACASGSDYPRRLGEALAQCETDLGRLIGETEATAAIAADALAAARALKN